MIDGTDEFVWHEVFGFPSDIRPEYDRAESAVWRKVVPDDAEVNRMGCHYAAAERAKGKRVEYRGHIDSTAGTVRSKKTAKGHYFKVEPFPEEGGDWHLHIYVIVPKDVSWSKNDKNDLRALMQEAFSPLKPHQCPRATAMEG